MKRVLISDIREWNGQGVLSVLGPTGSGKTSLVLREVRRRFPNQLKHPLLVSMDAVSVFRELDIGSAKPLSEERDPFDWRGIDLVDPTEQITAADFLRLVLPEINAALAAGRPVILVGGSHFYERALVEGMSAGEASNPAFQAELESIPSITLWDRLRARDERWATKIHQNDRYRLTRYLDLTERQGLSYEDLTNPRPSEDRAWTETSTLLMGLEESAGLIQDRMLERIQKMFATGWMDEVRALLAKYQAETPGLQAVGYREIVAFLATPGALQDDLESEILTAHMQLAKKQRTWLRGLVRRFG